MKYIVRIIIKMLGLSNTYSSIRNRQALNQVKRKKTNQFKQEFDKFKLLAIQNKDQRFPSFEAFPFLDDNTSFTSFDTHYVYHTAWAARILQKTKPEFHTDISSSLYFSAICSAFIPVRFYDYRPAKLTLSDLQTNSADLSDLHFENNSIASLSCMHTIEHIGLGRYGDPLDYNGDIKAMNELKRVLARNGNLLFVVPIGKPKIAFNAHRIYSYEQIIKYFSDLELKDFMLIPDNAIEAGIIENASIELCNKQQYGCGCFWFTKKENT